MREVEVSPRTRELLAAAKRDAPSALAKAKIWGGIAATTAAAAGAGAGVAGGAAAVAGGSGKLVVIGALFGSAVTVGLAIALMHVGPALSTPSTAPLARPAAAAAARPTSAAPLMPSPAAPDGFLLDLPAGDPAATAAPEAKTAAAAADPGAVPADLASSAHDAHRPADPARTRADDAARTRADDAVRTRADDAARTRADDRARAGADDPARAGAGDLARTGAGDLARAGADDPSRTRAGNPSTRTRGPADVGTRGGRDTDDALARETSLVAEARGALRRGDAQSALATVRAARSSGSRALEPEELALEAKSLRALGRDADAAAVESSLRARYPDHALAR